MGYDITDDNFSFEDLENIELKKKKNLNSGNSLNLDDSKDDEVLKKNKKNKKNKSKSQDKNSSDDSLNLSNNKDNSMISKVLGDKKESKEDKETSLENFDDKLGAENSVYRKVIDKIENGTRKAVTASVAAFKSANKAGVFSTIGNYVVKPFAGGAGFAGMAAFLSNCFARSAGKAVGAAVGNIVDSSEAGKKIVATADNVNGKVNKAGYILEGLSQITDINDKELTSILRNVKELTKNMVNDTKTVKVDVNIRENLNYIIDWIDNEPIEVNGTPEVDYSGGKAFVKTEMREILDAAAKPQILLIFDGSPAVHYKRLVVKNSKNKVMLGDYYKKVQDDIIKMWELKNSGNLSLDYDEEEVKKEYDNNENEKFREKFIPSSPIELYYKSILKDLILYTLFNQNESKKDAPRNQKRFEAFGNILSVMRPIISTLVGTCMPKGFSSLGNMVATLLSVLNQKVGFNTGIDQKDTVITGLDALVNRDRKMYVPGMDNKKLGQLASAIESSSEMPVTKKDFDALEKVVHEILGALTGDQNRESGNTEKFISILLTMFGVRLVSKKPEPNRLFFRDDDQGKHNMEFKYTRKPKGELFIQVGKVLNYKDKVLPINEHNIVRISNSGNKEKKIKSFVLKTRNDLGSENKTNENSHIKINSASMITKKAKNLLSKE